MRILTVLQPRCREAHTIWQYLCPRSKPTLCGRSQPICPTRAGAGTARIQDGMAFLSRCSLFAAKRLTCILCRQERQRTGRWKNSAYSRSVERWREERISFDPQRGQIMAILTSFREKRVSNSGEVDETGRGTADVSSSPIKSAMGGRALSRHKESIS